MPKLSNSDRQLIDALRELQRAWADTADGWRDQARVDFGRTYIDELDVAVRAAVNGIAEVNQLLRQVIGDCGS